MKKHIVECKSIGVNLAEDIARDIDNLIKTLPKECTYRRKGKLPEQAEVVSNERADISMISVESVDREGDVILAKGMNLEYFQRNPIVPFAHRYDEPPVGKCQWVRKVKGGMRAKTIYTDATELACAVWQMTQEGIIRGKSIGFLPTMIRLPSKEEIAMNPAWKDAGAIIESAILLEYSIAPVPVNQDALIESIGKGRCDRKSLERLGFIKPKTLTQADIAEIVSREFAKHAASITPECILRKMKEKYGV